MACKFIPRIYIKDGCVYNKDFENKSSITIEEMMDYCENNSACTMIFVQSEFNIDELKKIAEKSVKRDIPVYAAKMDKVILLADGEVLCDLDNSSAISLDNAFGTNGYYVFDFDLNRISELGYLWKLRREVKNQIDDIDDFSCCLEFKDCKLNSDGHLTVVVQDYKTNQVLMVAYMNEEAYNKTVETGIMTYYSRSRDELWIKGLTSGHFQYVRELYIDCDSDTLLAKVKQIGAACHTGSTSCFFNKIIDT